MADGPLPIGSLHVRDFRADLRVQRTLADLTGDDRGDVSFACLKCPHQGKMALAELRARFRPDAGLVDILNVLMPSGCVKAARDPSGSRACGFCYRDL